MRFEGTLQSWNDERGFGFIAADQGGEPVFVHIKAFGPGAPRPAVQQRISFEVELGPQGKKRARQAQMIRPARSTASAPRSTDSAKRQYNSPSTGSARWGTASLFALPAFLLLAAAIAALWRPPLWLLW